MIATGLAVEAVAAILVVSGLLLGPSGVVVLWASIGVVLFGLLITIAGVRRARPPRGGWIPPQPAPGGSSSG